MQNEWKDKIRDIQEATGWSLRTMAERTGIPVWTLSRAQSRDYAVTYADGQKIVALHEAVTSGVRVE